MPTVSVEYHNEARTEALGRPAEARTALEEQLLSMWSERVTVRPLGVMDHFFALGGDSLDAVRLLAMVERRYGTRIDRSRLFQSFTVATMAELLNEALGGRDD